MSVCCVGRPVLLVGWLFGGVVRGELSPITSEPKSEQRNSKHHSHIPQGDETAKTSL